MNITLTPTQRHALTYTRAVTVDRQLAINVADLHVIALLKMSAWLDRPHERERDLQDIGLILSDYLDDDDPRHWDDVQLRDTDFDDQGAFALALDLAAIIHPHHRVIIEQFLSRFTDTGTHHFERLSSAGRSSGRERHESTRRRLDLLHKGLGIPRAGHRS